MEPEQIQEEQTVTPVSKKSFNPMIIGGVIVVFIIILTGFVMLKGNKQNSAQDEAQTQPVQGVESVNETQVGDDRTVEFTAKTKTVEFTVDALGEFEYYCSVGQHRQNGQVGTLIAEE